MTNQIVLANPIATAVKPKPTKKEVVDAMVQLKVQENAKLNKANQEKRNKIYEQIEKKAIRYVVRNQSKTNSSINLYSYRGFEVRVSFEITELPEDIKALAEEYKKLDTHFSVDDKHIRKAIMEGINGHLDRSDRVQALINSPEAKKALKAMLTEIGV